MNQVLLISFVIIFILLISSIIYYFYYLHNTAEFQIIINPSEPDSSLETSSETSSETSLEPETTLGTERSENQQNQFNANLMTNVNSIAMDQLNTLAAVYAPPPVVPLPYPGYVYPPAGYPYPFPNGYKQLGGGYYYEGRRRR